MAIRMPGHRAFAELSECLIETLPAMARGVIYSQIEDKLFAFIQPCIGRRPEEITSRDATKLVTHFQQWFMERSIPRRVLIPCAISPNAAPRFNIGPVVFEFIDRIATSDFRPKSENNTSLDLHGFNALLQWMREGGANWLARVTVEDCESKRAQEVAELAVDFAIVSLRLAAPNLDTRSMTRLDARRGPPQKRTLSEAEGIYYASWTRLEPGMVLGSGTLPFVLVKAAPIFTAVGNAVSSFASGVFRLPKLEGAWCDAAYWLHEALVETIDAIAIAKLETALEVLVCAGNSAGSERRITQILRAFFSLKPEDPIYAGSLLTARKFAANLVRDRSRILHGTWSTLNTRSINRNGMERFVINVLRKAILELEIYAQGTGRVDAIEDFLDWVTVRKAPERLQI